MPNYDANTPHFTIQCGDLPDDKLQVALFDGRESVSRPFEFHMTLVSKDEALDAGQILNRKSTFSLHRGNQSESRIHGIISQFEQRGRTPDYVIYQAVLVPRIWRLGLNFGSQVFQKVTLEDVATKILKNAGFGSRDFDFQLSGTYPTLEYCVQYQESDLQFLNRRLEHFGVYYYFDQRDDEDVIVFTDRTNNLPVIPGDGEVAYNPNKNPLEEKETILELGCEERVVTGKVRLKEYNYEMPEKDLRAEARVDPDLPGVFYNYGEHFKNEKEGETLAKVRSEEILSTRKTFSGKSDCRLLHAGFKFKMAGFYRKEWNQDLMLVAVRHRGNQPGLFVFGGKKEERVLGYENSFEAVPADREYRPPRVTPVPKIPGIMTARVETGSGDEYAHLDESGRYKIRVPFDLGDRPDAEATRPIRLAQPYSGPGYGLHFPNHAGSELVWACVDGNVDRPLGLSTIPNPSNASPSVAANKQQNMIRTAAGNEIILNDKTAETQVCIKTADANMILLDDKDDKIDLVTTQKHRVTMDDKNQNITVQTTNGHLLIMDDKNTKITLQSKNGHRISINDTSGSENITLVDKSGENTFVIDITNKKLTIMTKNGSIDMHAPNGTIDIKATTLKVETKGDSTFKSANTKIEAKQDYSVKATNIKEEATMDYKEKGMNVKSEASMEHKTKGMNVTSEAGVNMQVKGTMVTVQSSGPNTIKGMPVLIN
jgi:type VI secretion system secreted protein VgrG